uniref:Uncharacterized protein n=1 Tax=viral metagenome TaxID=1070528 RepID=A0A6M3M3S3_9ZZZZ
MRKMFKKNEDGFNNLVPMVLAVGIAFAMLFIGAYINGTIHQELEDTTSNTNAISTMNNITVNWDSSIDIVQVVIIITILAMAIGAIFLFTRFQ